MCRSTTTSETRYGFIHSEDDKPNNHSLAAIASHLYVRPDFHLLPGTISCFHLPLITFRWFWGGELLRVASADTKLQAAARQRPCRWPLFTKLMEAESLRLQMCRYAHILRGKCVNSRYESQFVLPKLVVVYGEPWYFTQNPNGLA